MSVERGSLLYQTGRLDMAEQEFREALGREPSDALAHAMLGLCLSHRKQYAEATEEVRQAIALRPDWHLGYAALAQVMLERERLKEAAAAIAQAIQFDPFNANHYSTQAAIFLALRKWPDALAAANRGLEVQPDHPNCLNNRAVALVNLGRRDEAGATIQGALHRDPENATTHANQGWALLHAGDHRQAMVHFREALRLEPEMRWAKAGLVEALKARNIVYRLMLKYFLTMSRLSQQAQWGIIIGGYVGYKLLLGISRQNPAAATWIRPLLVAYVIFALLTWVSQPLFNLMLRLDRFGRYALSRDQTWGANCVGLTLLTALAFGAGFLLTANPVLLGGTIVSGVMLVPVSAIFSCAAGWPRAVMAGYAALVAAVGTAWVCATVWAERSDELHRSGVPGSLLTAFTIGVFLTGWVANALVGMRVRK